MKVHLETGHRRFRCGLDKEHIVHKGKPHESTTDIEQVTCASCHKIELYGSNR